MKNIKLLLLGLILIGCQSPDKQPVDYVDKFLGTSDSRWMMYPGVSLPFGMVKLSPDNQNGGWKAGYDYSINNIMGFSHIHSWTMGGLLVMPQTGDLVIREGDEADPDSGYRSRFDHKNENASPGYYSVLLDDYNVKAELTATTRCGFHRYTFNNPENKRVLLDLKFPTEYNFKVTDCDIRIVDSQKIVGYTNQHATFGSEFNEYKLCFVIKFDKPFNNIQYWDKDKIETLDNKITGLTDPGIVFDFSETETNDIQMQCGISFVSVEQAELNLKTEMDNFNWKFDDCVAAARAEWNDLLSKIKVETENEKNKIKFYTNLYRSYCSRTIMSDVNNMYTDMYEQPQQAESAVYGCDAFWNSFWNFNQLWNLVTPDISSQWVKSLLEISDKGGWLPKGPAGIEYTGIMVGSHEIPLIVAAYQNGIRNYNIERAYEAIKKLQTVPGQAHEAGGKVGNMNLASYIKYGFVPAEAGPVSNTLDYAYNDYCLAQFAKALNKTKDYDYFIKRSENYKNIFNSNHMYPWIKNKDNSWAKNFGIFNGIQTEFWNGPGFVEGNPWQYSWYVPHDVQGLINLLGDSLFINRLEDGFIESEKTSFSAVSDNFERVTVNHGNQPNMQAAYLFNYTSQPWRAQKWTRKIMDKYYGLGPLDGYPGDEDQGQMSSWFVMSSIGLFQMDGGVSTAPVYEFGSPLFDYVEIELDTNYYSNSKLIIEVENNSAENFYIKSVTLDDKKINRLWITKDELVNTGKIKFVMDSVPNTEFGKTPPPSMSSEKQCGFPYISSDILQFTEKQIIEISCGTPGAKIFFTTNGTDPTPESKMYNAPIEINKSTRFKMIATKDDFIASGINNHFVEKQILMAPVKINKIENGLDYEVFLWNGEVLPDYNKLKRISSGKCDYFDIKELKPREDHFALKYTGYIEIPKDAVYTFYTLSDDGSKLFIDSEEVVNNDGSHGPVEKMGHIGLAKGFHKLELQFYDDMNDEKLELWFEAPGIIKRKIEMNNIYRGK